MSKNTFRYPGKRVTTNGNTLVTSTEALISDAGVFYPITPSTEMGEIFQGHFAKGDLNAFGKPIIAIETEGEHAAQGGAIAISVAGKRAVNFTSGQGIVYGLEQYYHAPGKLSTMVLEVGARALTKHALNVHCGHDDIFAATDTGWIMLMAKDAQQAADQAIILRRVTELALNPGMNIQDGFLTSHLERTFNKPEAALVREFLGDSEEMIDCPTDAQRILFGPQRKRVPASVDLKNPAVIGPVQNQEHYMNGIAARRNNFSEEILPMLEASYEDYYKLTGRKYGLVSTYKCEDAETIFVALGSAAENIEAVSDYLEETRGEKVGVLHINVIRPFPEKAIISALKGKKRVIVLERTDEGLSGSNPLTRDIQVALQKAISNYNNKLQDGLGTINPSAELPNVFSGVYGLGSRDFRPEGIIGAYDYCLGKIKRKDGKSVADGTQFFYLGIDHPYAVISDEKPSCLPPHSIAIRFHSIGGWGMITTGKNLGEIMGEISHFVAKRDNLIDENGEIKEIVHISANPKYGSEKKGAPTNYFLVSAPERIRVNCDLEHVSVVLCCDPKIFLHTNPLNGLSDGGAFVWESNESDPSKAWERIPQKYRKEIIDKKIRIYLLNGFSIARRATKREDLQTRMQGNAFLGAFYKVSSFLSDYNMTSEDFKTIVKAQYVKKFGRFGDAVVNSNMTVMQSGFDEVVELNHGEIEAKDKSSFVGSIVNPCTGMPSYDTGSACDKTPMFKLSVFDKEYRAGLGYHQPSSPLASVGIMAAATGATTSKYVARREVPVLIEENCTQCMDCITVCPDTALPNTAQDISEIIQTAVSYYVSDNKDRKALKENLGDIEKASREKMLEVTADKEDTTHFGSIVLQTINSVMDSSISTKTTEELTAIFPILPIIFKNSKAIFSGREKKQAGSGGVFSIFVNDLCKGCAACVEACGSHEALKMVPETEELHAQNKSATQFLNFLNDTPTEYLGLFNADTPEESKAATLKMHLMMQSKYNALVSGDGACAGCGEKAVLRSVATVTESLMRPVYQRKANRIYAKADQLEQNGMEKLQKAKQSAPELYTRYRQTILHILMGYGCTTDAETKAYIQEHYTGDDKELIDALLTVLRQDAYNHTQLQAIEGMAPNGMSVMAMAAHTGCNTVYGSTPSSNPHPYPWMNSLFQDGATVGWLLGESFIQDHATHSVIPERLADMLLSDFSSGYSEEDYFDLSHFTDMYMTDLEVHELPKVWVIGGDGGMGDIGYQNVSKVVMQNRPNVKMLMLDTQVYSNTGGQNSESSVMTGGFDMNQIGPATEGKLTEKKLVAESFVGSHGSPYVAQVSMANAANLYKSLIDGLCYRGTAFYQAYTTCQPEHGVADHVSSMQALSIRDSRGMPEFVFNPQLGETYPESLNIKANPSYNKDWHSKVAPVTKKRYVFTVAHWAFTEARFRRHHKVINAQEAEKMILLEEKLKMITMNDITYRRFLDPSHRAYIPRNGVYVIDYNDKGEEVYRLMSRQMVIFCVERRKAWRTLQSMAGIENKDYIEQKEYLKTLDTPAAVV